MSKYVTGNWWAISREKCTFRVNCLKTDNSGFEIDVLILMRQEWSRGFIYQFSELNDFLVLKINLSFHFFFPIRYIRIWKRIYHCHVYRLSMGLSRSLLSTISSKGDNPCPGTYLHLFLNNVFISFRFIVLISSSWTQQFLNLQNKHNYFWKCLNKRGMYNSF